MKGVLKKPRRSPISLEGSSRVGFGRNPIRPNIDPILQCSTRPFRQVIGRRCLVCPLLWGWNYPSPNSSFVGNNNIGIEIVADGFNLQHSPCHMIDLGCALRTKAAKPKGRLYPDHGILTRNGTPAVVGVRHPEVGIERPVLVNYFSSIPYLTALKVLVSIHSHQLDCLGTQLWYRRFSMQDIIIGASDALIFNMRPEPEILRCNRKASESVYMCRTLT